MRFRKKATSGVGNAFIGDTVLATEYPPLTSQRDPSNNPKPHKKETGANKDRLLYLAVRVERAALFRFYIKGLMVSEISQCSMSPMALLLESQNAFPMLL